MFHLQTALLHRKIVHDRQIVIQMELVRLHQRAQQVAEEQARLPSSPAWLDISQENNFSEPLAPN